MTVATEGYGAVSTKNPDDENSFEEYDEAADYRYIPERPLTTQERARKLVSAGVPIVIAILLMLGFGWCASKALTPQHAKGVEHSAIPPQFVTMGPFPALHPTDPPAALDTDTTTTTKASSKTTKARSSSSAACADNPACHKLGLVGDCCPTVEGIQLGCCL